MNQVDPKGRPTLGWAVIDWIESRLVHGPGDVQGEPISLDPELARFIVKVYALDRQTGRRLYDEALLSRVKGRAKSELAGMLVCAEALGPVRFAGWEDGEPTGRPVRYPFVRCLATEEDQSSHTYLNAAYMLWAAREAGLWPEFAGLDLGRDWQTSTRILLPDGGEVVPSTASSAAKEGGKETLAVFDETHLYVTRELLRMHAVVTRNLVKRAKDAEPWGLQTSTMYAKGQGSIAEQTHARAADGSDDRLLVDHKGARRPGIRLDDDDQVLAELRYVYGPFIAHVDLPRLLRALRDERDTEEDRRRYWLGEATDVSAKFLPAGHWPACATPGRVVEPGTAVALGFDGSLRQDASAIRLVTEDGYHFYPPRADGTGPAVWERPELVPPGTDWEVPPHEVQDTLAYVHRTWRVVRGYYDPAWWGGYIAIWRGTYGADVVVPWWTNRDGPMARECRAIRTAIVQAELTHDGHPTAARHWANAHKRLTRVRDEQGRPMFTMAKEHPGSRAKIDTAIADTLARAARADALAAGLFEAEPARPAPDIF